ncbi:MAG TPA: hypothetical protein VMM54_14530 [Nitrospirota bacterium]|nr:hypothetical protein [Nitrospirota bacterium]
MPNSLMAQTVGSNVRKEGMTAGRPNSYPHGSFSQQRSLADDNDDCRESEHKDHEHLPVCVGTYVLCRTSKRPSTFTF